MGHALDKLTIKGFKSIKSLKDFELTSLNILIGGNGAGKSNFVDFFRMLHAMMDGNLKNYIRKSGGIGDLLFNGRKATEKLEFITRFGERGYRFKIVSGAKEDFSITDESRYYEHGTSGWWGLGDSSDGTPLLAREVKSNKPDCRYGKPVYDAIASWQIYHFHDTSADAGMRHAEIIQDNKKLRFNGANIAPFLLKLKKQCNDIYNEITEAVRLVTPFFDDFLLDVEEFGEKQKVNLSWRQKKTDYPMQPYHLSDGSIRFICLATALLQPDPPATIIIDEPELGLHPFAIDILGELVQSVSKKTQLIIATQSAPFIDNFSIENIIVVNRKNGASIFERLEEKNFNVWLENYSVGELWSKNVISGGAVYE
ncbi:MAG: recombinase RecF [Planctomycetota bacterium]|nr:MAG: recombinase RecF [Planctomycetota bacterium]